jgi:hypothetical protein
MNALVIFAHPEPASFSAALKNEAVAALSQAGVVARSGGQWNRPRGFLSLIARPAAWRNVGAGTGPPPTGRARWRGGRLDLVDAVLDQEIEEGVGHGVRASTGAPLRM